MQVQLEGSFNPNYFKILFKNCFLKCKSCCEVKFTIVSLRVLCFSKFVSFSLSFAVVLVVYGAIILLCTWSSLCEACDALCSCALQREDGEEPQGRKEWFPTQFISEVRGEGRRHDVQVKTWEKIQNLQLSFTATFWRRLSWQLWAPCHSN